MNNALTPEASVFHTQARTWLMTLQSCANSHRSWSLESWVHALDFGSGDILFVCFLLFSFFFFFSFPPGQENMNLALEKEHVSTSPKLWSSNLLKLLLSYVWTPLEPKTRWIMLLATAGATRWVQSWPLLDGILCQKPQSPTHFLNLCTFRPKRK